MSGTITDATGPVGDLTVKAKGLDVPALVSFLVDFSKGAGLARPTGQRPAPGATSDLPATMNVSATIEADRAVFGALAIERVQGRARITRTSITVDPAQFQVFGGQYDGTLELTLSDTSEFTLASSVVDIDMGELARFAGRPGSLTGHLSGRIDISGRASDVLNTSRGRARIEATDGSVKGLGLVRGIVLPPLRARGRSPIRARPSLNRSREWWDVHRRRRLRRNGESDVRIEGPAAQRHWRLPAGWGAIKVESRVQLSEALSAQAGRDPCATRRNADA
jgi:hypothetical protein